MNENIEKLNPIEYSKYENIDLDRLVIYAMVQLELLDIELSLENIIVGSFKLFPKKFSLVGYPEYPDATRVEKALWRNKGKSRQWIGGKTPHGYMLNDTTKIIGKQIDAQLSDLTVAKEKVPTRMRRKESILKETLESPAYIKYINNQSDAISDADLCYLLQGTLDSSKDTLNENLFSLKRIAEELERKDVKDFLSWLEQRFKAFLNK